MGKRKKKSKKATKGFEMGSDQPQIINLDTIMRNQGAKEKTKLSKKLRKKLAREQLHSAIEQQRKAIESRWHKVTVESSTCLQKKFLFESLANYVDAQFFPLGYHSGNNCASFFLENKKDAAMSIKVLDRRIQGNDGNPMKIKVMPINDPDTIPNANQLITIKEVIASRFNSEHSILDLSAFHLDPRLIEKDILVPLSSNVIMKIVVKFIRECGENIRGFNLSNNHLDCNCLKYLEELSPIKLSGLNLENNDIKNFTFLKYLKSFPLIELNLNSNPAFKNAKKTQSYMNTICKTFPNLKMLDNAEVNVQREKFSPSNMNSFDSLLDSSSQVITSISINEGSLQCFLEQYFVQFDTPQRISLLQAYISEAKISIQSMNPQIPNGNFEGPEGLNQFLTSFPETKHVHSSFNLKIVKTTPAEGCVEISGLCEFNGLNEPVNFVRKMVVVPYKAGLCCSMDMLELK